MKKRYKIEILEQLESENRTFPEEIIIYSQVIDNLDPEKLIILINQKDNSILKENESTIDPASSR